MPLRFRPIYLGLLVLLAACTPGSAATQSTGASSAASGGQAGRTFRMIIPAEPDQRTSIERRQVLKEVIDGNVMESLMGLDNDGKPTPRLATSWEPRDMGATWRLQLRKNVKFQNGEPFSAKDVVSSVKWLNEDEGGATRSRIPINEAVAVDDFTVDLKFKQPQPLFPLQQIYFQIYPESAAKDAASKKSAAEHPIGTGPYTFQNRAVGQSISLTRNDNYWGTKGSFANVTIIWRPDPGVRVAALLAGEADWVMDIPFEEAGRLPNKVSVPAPDRYVLRLDETVQQNPILADIRLRMALDYAVDREALLKLFQGQAAILPGQFGQPGEFGYNPAIKARSFDLAKAKSLVSDANAVGKTVTMLCTPGKLPKDREVCQALTAMFEATGLKVNVLNVQPGDDVKYINTTGADKTSPKTDIVFTGIDLLFETESRFQRMAAEGGTQSAINDPKVWDLGHQEAAESDLKARGDKLSAAWASFFDQADMIPLLQPTSLTGMGKNVSWTPNIAGWAWLDGMKFTD